MTAVANSAFTAAQFNTHVRDNLLETAPAKATGSGTHFVGTGTNSIAQRQVQEATVSASESTTSTSYTDLNTPGPAVTVTTGTRAIVLITADIRAGTAGQFGRMSVTISGATSDAAIDSRCLKFGSPGAGDSHQSTFAWMPVLTAGSNTFTAKYRSSSGTSTYADRRLVVLPF
jgi:hypothetical protein